MVVTRSRWDLYLPDRFRYGAPATNMDVIGNGTPMSRDALQAEMDAVERVAHTPQQLQPLQIQVPSSGVHFALEKLYANQADEAASVSIPYTSDFGATLGQAIALLGTALFWAGLWAAWRDEAPLGRRGALALSGAGLLLLLLPVGYLQTSPMPPLALSLLALVAAAALLGRDRIASRRPTLESVP